MNISSINLISFLGHKELLDKIDTDFYTGKRVQRQHRTVEHILPKSFGGENNISNYAMVDSYINSQRSNIGLKNWILLHPEYLKNMKKYVLKYWDTIIDNVKHGQEVNNTVKKLTNIDLYL